MARLRLSKVKESNSRSQQGRERSGERRNWEQASGCRNYILVYTEVGRDTRRQIHTGSDLHCQHTINSMIAGSSFPLAVTLPSLANTCSLTPASFCNSLLPLLPPLPHLPHMCNFVFAWRKQWQRPAERVKVPP